MIGILVRWRILGVRDRSARTYRVKCDRSGGVGLEGPVCEDFSSLQTRKIYFQTYMKLLFWVYNNCIYSFFSDLIIVARVAYATLFCDGLSFFSAKILRIWPTDFNQIFVKPQKSRSLEFVQPEFLVFVCEGQEGRETPQKSENSDIGVQYFDHNSETNQDIKNRKSNLTSSINSKDNDI